MTNEQVLEIFKKTRGVLKGHFLLTSGRHSDSYMQCAKLFTYPAESEKLCSALSKKLSGINADFVLSPAIGGIIMGYEMARQLKLPNFFAERVNDIMELRRGFELPEGSKVLIVEDVVTTGSSVKDVIKLVESLGSEVVAVASIVDRSNGKVDFGVRFECLLSMDIKSYEAGECPICATGAPLVKPGSRKK